MLALSIQGYTGVLNGFIKFLRGIESCVVDVPSIRGASTESPCFGSSTKFTSNLSSDTFLVFILEPPRYSEYWVAFCYMKKSFILTLVSFEGKSWITWMAFSAEFDDVAVYGLVIDLFEVKFPTASGIFAPLFS